MQDVALLEVTTVTSGVIVCKSISQIDTYNALGGPLPGPSKEIHYGKFPLAGAQIHTHSHTHIGPGWRRPLPRAELLKVPVH